ncbi:hypothetical protein L2E82_30248 [Cichorium intybus]|uniref:Uncharacterized protein n=1 Tax=Cichorium intybus TaxID=13427 RepID=A0ACB9D041_CICIN|nr:hypothetical protein L2E82_30248 [Cichorium intybus]
MISSKIGVPLAFDSYTEDMCLENKGRNAYARILIQISVSSNWKCSINVNTWDFVSNTEVTLTLPVEYAGKPHSCSHCKVFGHLDKVCAAALVSSPIALQPESSIKRQPDTQPPYTTRTSEGFTVVTKKNNNKPQHGKQSSLVGSGISPNNQSFGGSEKTFFFYDLNPAELNAVNRFDVLNSIDDSFTILCDESGIVTPITPLPTTSSSTLPNNNSGTHAKLTLHLPYLTSSVVYSGLEAPSEPTPMITQFLEKESNTCESVSQ